MTFPIVLKDSPEAKAPGDLYYEVASNGVFQVRETAVYRAVTRSTRDIPGLLPGAETLELRFPPLPRDLVAQTLGFFDAVSRRWRAEAIVLLFYRPESREFRAIAPPQRIFGYRDYRGRLRAELRLEYESVARPDGFLPFGSIHSHADHAAFASGIDCDDELDGGDGLHVVFGHFGSNVLSRHAAFTVNGRRFRVAPERVLPRCEVPTGPARRDWMECVRFEEGRSWVEAAGYVAGRFLPVGRPGPHGHGGSRDT